ncbi:DP-EP family protein [Alteromonas gilva]|uniref:DP-EP family protein n=1 Tax=Alteromonas gilva TaxID=2987522 RepID=A0ABT5L500_9ALTE|nr:DP-EP family protein [Alteromonas gilva]MDC8830843.1 DP-EP family protein [Alteromonas gilva]
MSVAPAFNFTVAVNINEVPPVFTIYDDKHHVTNKPIQVTQPNTTITYQLIDNTDELVFVDPLINHDPHHDLTYNIADDGQTITFTDSDADNETICMQLQVIQSTTPAKIYTSPDPQIRNRKES